jgi:hypothetical protein
VDVLGDSSRASVPGTEEGFNWSCANGKAASRNGVSSSTPGVGQLCLRRGGAESPADGTVFPKGDANSQSAFHNGYDSEDEMLLVCALHNKTEADRKKTRLSY